MSSIQNKHVYASLILSVFLTASLSLVAYEQCSEIFSAGRPVRQSIYVQIVNKKKSLLTGEDFLLVSNKYQRAASELHDILSQAKQNLWVNDLKQPSLMKKKGFVQAKMDKAMVEQIKWLQQESHEPRLNQQLVNTRLIVSVGEKLRALL